MPASATTGYPSSYIATTSATVTRATDVLSIPYVFGQTGTMLALCLPYNWSTDQDGITSWFVFGADDTNNTRLARNGATTMAFRRPDAGGAEGSSYSHGLTAGVLSHQAMTWDASAITGYANGSPGATPDSTLTPPYNTNTLLRIGQSSSGVGSFSGWVALLVWPRALSAAELLAIKGAHVYA